VQEESMGTISERSSGTSKDLERSVTPNRGTEALIDQETVEDYLKFPDPRKYLVGFIFGLFRP
jgi:hypothetical protein